MGRTLANTIKWQISSSLIHGFMGSIQKAFGYAQDLNESLNNIRIVTEKDEKMYNEKNYILNGDENEDNIYNKS